MQILLFWTGYIQLISKHSHAYPVWKGAERSPCGKTHRAGDESVFNWCACRRWQCSKFGNRPPPLPHSRKIKQYAYQPKLPASIFLPLGIHKSKTESSRHKTPALNNKGLCHKLVDLFIKQTQFTIRSPKYTQFWMTFRLFFWKEYICLSIFKYWHENMLKKLFGSHLGSCDLVYSCF